MLRSIEVENYRGFEKYRADGLARVNLLVGDNGAGKTALLEAAYLLESGFIPDALQYITTRRGEIIPARGELKPGAGADATISGLFHGRAIASGSRVMVSAPEDDTSLTLSVLPMADSQARDHAQRYLEHAVADAVYMLLIERVLHGEPCDATAVPLRRGAAIDAKASTHHRQTYGGEDSPLTGPRFLPVESADNETMRSLWNTLVAQGREEELVPALAIMVPVVSRISYMTEPIRGVHSGAPTGFLISTNNGAPPAPLGSLGDGASRMLALAMAILAAEPGTIALLDEIDTGLHYSIMGDMWRVVIETAQRRDVQVLASTHSFDCIRGLAWLCEAYPELGSEVALHKISPTIEMAVTADAESIVRVVKQKIEVR